jgi:hypothetical protein
MNDPTTKERLKNLIAKSKEDKLIKELLLLAKHQPSDVADQIFSLSAAYNKYTEEISFGTLRGENERVTSNDLSRRMLMVINLLEEEVVEETHPETHTSPAPLTNSTDTTTGSSPSKDKRLLGISALILLLFGLIFWLTKPNFSDSVSPNIEAWLGTWSQEIEASGELINSGTITFEAVDGSLKGKSEMRHNNGSFTEMGLFNITFDENQNSIQGSWRSEELEADGSFKFSLQQNQSSFKGFYTIHPDLEKSFFWNGKR